MKLRLLLSLAFSSFIIAPALADDATFEPEALLQVWGTVMDQDLDPQADPAGYGDPEDDPGFKIRRARVGGHGDLPGGFDYKVIFGAHSPYDVWSGSETFIGLDDAYLGWSNDMFAVSVGQQKISYSRENMMSSSELIFTERAVSTAYLVPDRETGINGALSVAGLKISAGAYNGSGSFLGDNNTGLLGVGRVEYTLGDQELAYSTWGKVDSLVLAVGANGLYNADLSTGTLTTGGDLLLRVAGLALLVEGNLSSIKPTNTDIGTPEVLDGTKRVGGLAQVGYSIGPFENAVRVSYYDDNTASEDNGDLIELYGGTTWHQAEDYARVGVGYVHRQELAGRLYHNDTVRLWAQVRY